MKEFDESEFVSRICSKLDEQVLPVDSQIAGRLDQIRKQALQRQTSPELAKRENHEDDDLLVDGILSRLDDKLEPTPEIRQRLDRARKQAIAQEPGATQTWQAWQMVKDFFAIEHRFGAGMIATACLTVTIVSLFYVNSDPIESFSAEQEMMLIASADDLELYENLDFYLWLEENGIPD